MKNCTFCGSNVEAGTGMLYVKRDGTILNFCKAKCRRNMLDLGRVNRHVRWTQAAEEHKSERVQSHKVAPKADKPAAKPKKAAAKPAAAKPAQ